MILINRNTLNTCYFTLTEKATLVSPYYLFQFQSIDSNESTFFTAADQSVNTERFNKFYITESATTNYLDAVITLQPGEYNYYVYEMTGSTNLSLTGITSMVEQGQVYVSGASATSYTYTNNDETENIIYFNS